MITLIKNLIYWFLSLFNFKGAVILMYHSIGANAEFSTVRPADFAQQMAYLKENNFNVISLADLASLMERGEPMPAKTICLTFDDGYEDNFFNALPILKKYSFPAAIFVSTAYLGADYISRRGIKNRILSRDEIQTMSTSGSIAFGSHSHQHLKLPKLEDAQIGSELTASKNLLSEILGVQVLMLSYPSGWFDERIERVARKKFQIICTTNKGRVTANTPIWRLKRNSIDSRVTFAQFRGMVKIGRL